MCRRVGGLKPGKSIGSPDVLSGSGPMLLKPRDHERPAHSQQRTHPSPKDVTLECRESRPGATGGPSPRPSLGWGGGRQEGCHGAEGWRVPAAPPEEQKAITLTGEGEGGGGSGATLKPQPLRPEEGGPFHSYKMVARIIPKSAIKRPQKFPAMPGFFLPFGLQPQIKFKPVTFRGEIQSTISQ